LTKPSETEKVDALHVLVECAIRWELLRENPITRVRQGVYAGQAVGVKEVEEGIWLVSFMNYDLGYIGLEEKTCNLAEPLRAKSVMTMKMQDATAIAE
jgi:hypothetical protein